MNNSSESFKEAHQDAQQRVQHIQKEIVHAQHVIRETKGQLDSIENNVHVLKAQQIINNTEVYTSKQTMDKTLALEENKLNQLKFEYNAIQNEKRLLEIQLDSLSASIQHNF